MAAIFPDSELDPAHLVRGSGSRSSDLKEALHLGIFQSVVAAAGCTFSIENIDQGIDVMVHQRIPGVQEKATIDFQLKCTATDITSDGEVVVELPLQRYDEMRHKDKNQPFLLVAQHVAKNEDDWVDFSGDKSLFAVKNYWLNLTGFGDSSVTSGKVRVKVPTHQVFDDNQLIQFFAQLRKGALPK